MGIGGGIYLVSNLGPGPRDGLMIGLQKQGNRVRIYVNRSRISSMYVRKVKSGCWLFHPLMRMPAVQDGSHEEG